MSTVPAAKAKIVELLAANNALAGVNVSWSGPTTEGDLAGGENVWLGKVEQTETWGAVGNVARPRRDEEYTIELWVQTVAQGNFPQTLEERWWTLRLAVAEVLRAHPNLDGIVTQWVELLSTKVETEPMPDGWFVRGALVVHAKALRI